MNGNTYSVLSLSFSLAVWLNQVLVHLRSKSWDTRIAAGQALEAIVGNVPQWDPSAGEYLSVTNATFVSHEYPQMY